MRYGLEGQWGSLISQTTVSHNPEGDAVTPFTATHLDWAAVEHQWRFCGKPWPDFANEGWDWCQGRTPGTRGFTCVLWLSFHSLLAGTEQASVEDRSYLPQQALHIIRGTVQHFFGCQSCRDHFLAVPVGPEDLASPEAQMLWLWSAHNEATVRIGVEERQHSPT